MPFAAELSNSDTLWGRDQQGPQAPPPKPSIPFPFSVAIAGGAVHSRLGLNEAFDGSMTARAGRLAARQRREQPSCDEIGQFRHYERRTPVAGQAHSLEHVPPLTERRPLDLWLEFAEEILGKRGVSETPAQLGQ